MSLFEQILNTNIINFLIVVSTLVLIFKKAHLGDLIEKMADDIRKNVEKSSLDAKSAIDEYKTTKRLVKDTPKLQEDIISNAKINAQNAKENIEKNTTSSLEEIKASLEKTYAFQDEKLKNITIKELYSACIDMARDEVIKRLDDDTQKRLINASIDELDKIEGVSLE